MEVAGGRSSIQWILQFGFRPKIVPVLVIDGDCSEEKLFATVQSVNIKGKVFTLNRGSGTMA